MNIITVEGTYFVIIFTSKLTLCYNDRHNKNSSLAFGSPLLYKSFLYDTASIFEQFPETL